MQQIIIDLIGTYTPVTYLDPDGNEIVASGLAGVDWTFVFGGAFALMFIFCLFRILGVLLKK